MNKSEQAAKLQHIAELDEGELRGWWRYVMTREFRPKFDGEKAALLTRARELGISFSEVPT